MDVRRNFTKMDAAARKRVIEAIKWMKKNERSGTDGLTVSSSANGGVYQRYVNFHAQGGVEADIRDFEIFLSPEPKDTLHSIVIDGEEWVSPTKEPVTEVGLQAFFDAMPITPGGLPGMGGPFNTTVVVPPSPLPILIGNINHSPFADINIRIIPDGATVPTERAFSGTVQTGVKYRLDTYQMAHRSAAFLPWHRVFLRMFEKDLQFADKQLHNDGKITLPYWNWSRDNDWDEKAKASVWHKENFGGFSDTPAGTITGDHFSPASGWELFNTARVKLTGTAGELRRRRIADRTGSPSDTLPLPDGVFPSAKAVSTVLAKPDYVGKNRGGGGGGDGSGGNRRFAGDLEHELHDPVHGVVGDSGQMSNMLFSPQDPIFWLFHCNVDRLWSRWQWLHDKAKDSKYPKFGMLPGRRRNDPMQPWAGSGASAPPYEFKATVSDVLNAANLSANVNAANLLGKGYRYDSLSL